MEPNAIGFSPGIVPALNMCVLEFTGPGDRIVVQPPVYFPFFPAVTNHGRELVYNQLIERDGQYEIDYQSLEDEFRKGVKLFFLCNPHNPVGRVWTRQELNKLAELCVRYHVLVLSDEIHSDLIFEGHKHIPLASISEEVAQNCMVSMAPSKTFNVAGFSSSLLFAPNKSLKARYERAIGVGHLHMGNIFGTVAMEAAYTNGDDWLEQMLSYLWGSYQLLEDFIQTKLPKVKVMKPEATYLIWLDFTAYGMKNQELSEFATKKAKVGLNDGGRFGTGGDGWLRINIGCPRSILIEALERLEKAFG